MAAIAIVFGALLTILGGVIFALASTKSPTALIPSALGVLLVILGLVARNEKATILRAMTSRVAKGIVPLLQLMHRATRRRQAARRR